MDRKKEYIYENASKLDDKDHKNILIYLMTREHEYNFENKTDIQFVVDDKIGASHVSLVALEKLNPEYIDSLYKIVKSSVEYVEVETDES